MQRVQQSLLLAAHRMTLRHRWKTETLIALRLARIQFYAEDLLAAAE
jgi:hypothetical protein